ncbi:MAG: hypothetical protein DRO67_08560, partial [Candidatus Asgardarchaeum californiense]
MRPYGDTLDDGRMQLAFTLPVKYSEKAKKAAEKYVSMLNFKNISVVHAKMIAEGFTYFVVYAEAVPELDYSTIKASKVRFKHRTREEINKFMEEDASKNISIVGATIGSDAHTVGLDAIMNMKGYHGDYGLERYKYFYTNNYGAQYNPDDLIFRAVEKIADVILISQTVTQNDIHIKNLKDFINTIKTNDLENKFVLIAG